MSHTESKPRRAAPRPWLLTLCLLAAAFAAWLLTRHAADALQALPYLLLLACPLMHLFSHGNHHHEDH